MLIYGQWAEGFRIGRGQVQSATCDGRLVFCFRVLIQIRAETLEFGIKSAWLDNRITFNAAVYQTDWDDIPVAVSYPGSHLVIQFLMLAKPGHKVSNWNYMPD